MFGSIPFLVIHSPSLENKTALFSPCFILFNPFALCIISRMKNLIHGGSTILVSTLYFPKVDVRGVFFVRRIT